MEAWLVQASFFLPDRLVSTLHSNAQIARITKQVGQAVDANPPVFAPAEIKRLRERNKVSQPVFARYPNTSESTVEKWEAGTKPEGARAANRGGAGTSPTRRSCPIWRR